MKKLNVATSMIGGYTALLCAAQIAHGTDAGTYLTLFLINSSLSIFNLVVAIPPTPNGGTP